MKKFILFFLLTITISSFAQGNVEEPESAPVFNSRIVNGKTIPGGMNSFLKYIINNYQQPDQEGIKGKVVVSFVIDTDGKIVDIEVIKDVGFGTGAEAIRVLKASPMWTPGQQDGKPVRVKYTLPINISTVMN